MQKTLRPLCQSLALALLLGTGTAQAQSVGIGTATPDASSVLELSTTNKGLLLPRLTLVQRNAIGSPAAGLMIYQTDNTPGLYIYGGTSWSLLPNATQTTGDNLGNHTATQDLSLGTYELTGNGGTTGLSINSGGVVKAASQRLSGLAGNGARLVQADANGNLTTQDAALSTAVSLAATPLLSSTALTTNPRDVAVAGTYAYVLLNNSNNGLLYIYNISTPTAPVLTGTLTLGGAPEAIAVSGAYVYVANNSANTLQIVNVSAPAAPTLAATIGTGSGPAGVAVSGSYAYVTNESSNTLQLFNVATPTAPVLAATIATQNTDPRGIALKGDYAYVASSGPLEVFDISTPASPVAGGTFGDGLRYSVTVSGQYAYATGIGGRSGCYVYDLSNPAAPVQVGEYHNSYSMYDVAVSGSYAYVTTSNNQLLLLDVSTPAAPTLVATHTAASSYRVAVSGQVAYLANRNSGNTFQAVRFLQPSVVTAGPDGSLSTTPTSTLTDNLGNHTATQALNLAGNKLVGNGGTSGISISSAGAVTTDGNTTISGTATATSFAYATAQTNYLTLGPQAFRSMDPTSYQERLFTAVSSGTLYTRGVYMSGTSGTEGYLLAPVNLPNGAIVTAFSMTAYDNDASTTYQPDVRLVRAVQSAGFVNGAVSGSPLATVALTADATTVQSISTATIANATVDNNTYHYYVVYHGNQGTTACRLSQVRITYTMAGPGQ